MLIKYYLIDKNEKDGMSGLCSTYGEIRGVYRVLVRKPEERENLKDLGIDGRIILR